MSHDGEHGDGELEINVRSILDQFGFDHESTVLTSRQAEVLTLRENGFGQSVIAERLGCSRANVSNIEASARRNVSRARETVAFAELLAAPVTVEIPASIDLFDVPNRVYDACDEAGVKVRHGAPELVLLIRDFSPPLVDTGTIKRSFVVHVTSDGDVRLSSNVPKA